MKSYMKSGVKVSVAVFAFVLMLSAGACKQQNQVIDKVLVKASDDMQSVRVSLVFAQSVQENISGFFPLKDAGTLFVTASTPESPFQIGFDLNTAVLNDQDYVHLEPTDNLPNGVPLGLGYPLVQVNAPQPISPSFDLYGYVDVLHAKWLGVAAMFNFINDKTFVAGLTISQAFQPNVEGKPAILASVFGPTMNPDGTLKRNGGVMLLANVRQLLGSGSLEPNREVPFFPKKKVYYSGPGAALR